MNKFKTGDLIKWSDANSEIIWLITEDKNIGIIIHSKTKAKDIGRLGSIWDLSEFNENELSKFIGTVNLTSS